MWARHKEQMMATETKKLSLATLFSNLNRPLPQIGLDHFAEIHETFFRFEVGDGIAIEEDYADEVTRRRLRLYLARNPAVELVRLLGRDDVEVPLIGGANNFLVETCEWTKRTLRGSRGEIIIRILVPARRLHLIVDGQKK